MKAFRSFDPVRAALRDAALVLKPNGPGTNGPFMEIGTLENDAFYGRIPLALCTNEFRALCTDNRISFQALEMLCREPEHASFASVLIAIAEAYWGYVMAHKHITTGEEAFFLLYASQTFAADGKNIDLSKYDTSLAFGLYCLDRALEE